MKKLIVISLTCLIPLAGAAQQVNNELKALIRETFSYFPRLKEAEESVNAAGLRTGLAKTGYVPTMNAGFTYNYLAPVAEAEIPVGPGVTQLLRFQPNHNLNGNIALNYVVYDFGRLQAGIRRSKEELMMAKYQAELQRMQLAAQVSQYYYGLIYLKKSIAIEDSLIHVLNENMRIVERKLAYGDALQLDLLSIQGSLDMETMRRIELEATYRKQLIFIEYLTGRKEVTVQQDQFDFAVNMASEGYFVEAARKLNYEFSVAAHRIEASKMDLRFYRSQYLPFVSINAAAGIRNGYQPNVDEMRFNYIAGAGVTIPILDAVKTSQQVKISKSIIRQQEISLESLENTYRRDIGTVLEDIRSKTEQMDYMENQLKAASEALRIANSRFNAGTATYLELINAAYNLQKVQLQKVQIEYNLCLSNIELARLSGTVFY